VFTVHVENAVGPSEDASGVLVSVTFSSSSSSSLLSYVSSVAVGGGSSFDVVSGVWSVGALSAGSSSELLVTALVVGAPSSPSASLSYVLSAEVVSCEQADPDSTPGNAALLSEDDNDSSVLVPPALIDLSLSIVSESLSAVVGTEVSFTLTLSNAGPSYATGVSVTCGLPSGYSFVSADVVGADSGTGGIGGSFDDVLGV
jgi:uncharacterized repeat protein (TIGR01451 family)